MATKVTDFPRATGNPIQDVNRILAAGREKWRLFAAVRDLHCMRESAYWHIHYGRPIVPGGTASEQEWIEALNSAIEPLLDELDITEQQLDWWHHLLVPLSELIGADQAERLGEN